MLMRKLIWFGYNNLNRQTTVASRNALSKWVVYEGKKSAIRLAIELFGIYKKWNKALEFVCIIYI
jgi:hypothetical protein